MKEYDVIAFGTGSAMNIVSAAFGVNPNLRVAVIEKDRVGGICLTRGCIPSKMILYQAETAYHVREAHKFGVHVDGYTVDPMAALSRARRLIEEESSMIERSLIEHPNIDLYKGVGEFVDEYTVSVNGVEIRADKILLCTGSRPFIPPIPGLREAGFVTSDDFFFMDKVPDKWVVIGGGYVGLELGFFLAMAGRKVTLLEMKPRIAPLEEPEVSAVLQKKLGEVMDIRTRHKVVEVEKRGDRKVVIAEGPDGGTLEFEADEILVAVGRRSNSDLTKPEKTGVKTDERGWIITNEYLETTKPGIWACGDANGKYMFKHKANYESQIVFHNAFLGRRVKADYHAVPHAIFTYPEVAAVGMKQEEAQRKHRILVGYYKYVDTAKGEAMMADEDYFVKVIVEEDTYRILGAHIVGPYASILIQEIVNLMYTDDESAVPVFRGMHIHPALSEVVERAFFSLAPPDHWHVHGTHIHHVHHH